MRVVIFGATGMIGSGVLTECIEDDRIDEIVVLVRSATGVSSPKLRDVVHEDFFDYTTADDDLRHVDACLFCLGVSAAGMSEEEYHRLTHDLTLAAAEAILELNPDVVFLYVSGQGTDSSESGRFMWARVKGKTENRLLGMSFAGAFMFRPGFIQPVKGARSKTRLYRALYAAMGPLYPLLRRLFPNQVTNSEILGRAMVQVAVDGYPKPILEMADINAVGEAG